jgi:renalase
MHRTTAILGAGIAGLSAAQELRRHGRSVMLFDKGRRPGGRACTRRQPPTQWDHGAQFFTVRDAEFAAAIAPLVQQGQIQRWIGPFATLKDGAVGPDPRPGAERWVGVPGMSALAAGLAAGLAIETGLRIVGLQATSAGWWLDCKEATDQLATRYGPFDELILALPPSQAWDLIATAAPAHPCCALLEHHRQTLQPCLAAMVEFGSPLNLPAAGLFVEDPVLGFVAHDGSKPGRGDRPTYMLHATATWSAAQVEREPAQFASDMLHALARLLDRRLPDPSILVGHRWRYALMQPPPTPCSPAPAAGAAVTGCQPGLAIAGDWLVGGRVEGAFCSGLIAARQLLTLTAPD